jgi:transcription elongation factor GreA
MSTLYEAAQQYLDSLSTDERLAVQAEVQRFVRWLGADRAIDQVRGQEVANYAETLTGGVTDAARRVEAVRAFLSYAKRAGLTTTNLGIHLRVRKTGSKTTAAPRIERRRITPEEKAALEAELESLKAQRPQILADIRRAMADKDFRENAPLDAARDQQARVEGRIREIEAILTTAEVIEREAPTSDGTVDLGSTVLVRNLQSNREMTYTLVLPGDVNPVQGKISLESPVGKALLHRRVGDEVEVQAPSGVLRLRIERID